MAFFTSKSRSPPLDERGYSPAQDEESKPLHTMHEDRNAVYPDDYRHDDEDHATTREIFALSRSLRRTNLFLKVIIGLLCVTIIALLSMNVPDTLKKLIKGAACAPDRLLKSPVPPLTLETRIFQKSPLYSQRPNKISDTAWDGLLPVRFLHGQNLDL
jgi:hypothetical protein